jgi:hypothetical protein
MATAYTRAALKTELQNDPASLGYAAHVAANDDQALASMLNDQAVGASKGYTLQKATLRAADLLACMTVADYTSRSADQKAAWQLMLIASADTGVPTGNANIVAQFNAIWSGATTTLANASAALSRSCSRAEQLWGESTTISREEVGLALRSA